MGTTNCDSSYPLGCQITRDARAARKEKSQKAKIHIISQLEKYCTILIACVVVL